MDWGILSFLCKDQEIGPNKFIKVLLYGRGYNRALKYNNSLIFRRPPIFWFNKEEFLQD